MRIISFQEIATFDTSESSPWKAEGKRRKTIPEIYIGMQILTFHVLFLQNQLGNYPVFSLSTYK